MENSTTIEAVSFKVDGVNENLARHLAASGSGSEVSSEVNFSQPGKFDMLKNQLVLNGL